MNKLTGSRAPLHNREDTTTGPSRWILFLILLVVLGLTLPVGALHAGDARTHYTITTHSTKHGFPFVISRTVYYLSPGSFQYSVGEPRYQRIFSRNTMARIHGIYYYADYGPSSRKRYSIGWERMNRGQFYRASKAFQRVLDDSPDSYGTGIPRVGLLLSQALEYRDTRSVPHLVTVLQEHPHALLHTPFSKSIDRDIDRLRQQLHDEVEYNPERPENWLLITALNLVQHRLLEARRSFDSLRGTESYPNLYSTLETLCQKPKS